MEWQDGGVPSSEVWVDNVPSPEALSHIAVFDAHCARVFVDEQAAISYIPYGMDILTQLSASLKQIQTRLEVERQQRAFDRSALLPLTGSTEVGRLVSTLSRKTKPKDVRALATLSDAEVSELRQLQELLQSDAVLQQAKRLRQFCTRLDSFIAELKHLTSLLDDAAASQLRQSFEQLHALFLANQLAASAFAQGYLQGTGTDPWERLLESAIEFAKVSYPDHEFPGPEGSNCVLCQQPLSPEAHSRLHEFLRFLRDDIQARFNACRREVNAQYQPVANAPIGTFPADKAILSELAEMIEGAPERVRDYVSALGERRQLIVAMAPSRVIDTLPTLPEDPATELWAYREQLQAKISSLEQGMTPQQQAEKAQRLQELEARVKLQPLVETVVSAIQADEWDWRMKEAWKLCNTATLTKKHGELYERTVTADLQASLQRELAALGAASIKLELDLAGQRGQQMQRLKLVSANTAFKVKPSGVLSEGEQRAIALASFLAEVNLGPGGSGIVFDDPVTSLDHRRRERIARRLAAEAKKRQVIVFTHDLAFAHELIECAKMEGHKATVRHVFAAGPIKGKCDDKLPFDAQKLSARINSLKDTYQRARKALEDEGNYTRYDELVRAGYRKLRDSWELLVEDHLFAGTLKRFRRPVQTLRLRAVRVEDADAKAIYEGLTRTSYFVHEGGDEAPPALPEPHEFLADIDALEAALMSIDSNSKRVAFEREKLGIPSS
ncbi:AAA family ATPase [Hydrogenophaga sp. XSHU_21]